ncbi:MAG: nitrous oxide-stimulated promoter family protein [Ignavibacteriae bacterium]|nr:nitrous oxide-stimulated promoter family protein [Ignavibacteriota bacterium]
MIFFKSRIEREKITVGAMIKLYCRLEHGSRGTLCSDCDGMFDYVMKKLDKCPFDEDKPTCLNCSIHCYKSVEREKIRQVMRFSGPKMLIYHPIHAILHLIDNWIKKNEVKSIRN